MNVTSLRSMTQGVWFWLRGLFFQLFRNSSTQTATRRPCRIHRLSADVSLMVILSTCSSPVLGRKTEMHLNLQFDGNRLAVQGSRLILPLQYGLQRFIDQQWMSA